MEPTEHTPSEQGTGLPDSVRIQVAAVAAQQIALDEKEARLAQSAAELRRREQETESGLRLQQLRLDGDMELAREQLREGWTGFKQAQGHWRKRRGLERAALRVRADHLEDAARRLVHIRHEVENEQRVWLDQRRVLEIELAGLESRVQHQRQLLSQQEARLCEVQEALERQPLQSTNAETTAAPASIGTSLDRWPMAVVRPAPDSQRVVDLERIADELTDQRCQLAEAWAHLANVHQAWHADHCQATQELEALAVGLHDRELAVETREEFSAQAEATLRRRHEELGNLQDQMIAWRSQLRADESGLEIDKVRLLSDLRSREALAEQQLAALLALRDRWTQRRQQEVEQLQRDRAALETFRKEIAKVRQELLARAAALEDEKRNLAEKALALEHYRDDVLARGKDPEAPRHLEQLRRRWLTQNADAIRRALCEREALQAELYALEERHEALHTRAAHLAAAEKNLAEKQSAWESQQIGTAAQDHRVQHDLRQAQAQRMLAEEQLASARGEIEQVIRALLEQSVLPTVALDRAA